MFDVQVARHRSAPVVPEEVLGSIAAYYRRVTITASPMGRLVALVMLVLLAGLVAQAVDGDVPTYVSIISIAFAVEATGLAVIRVFGDARRLGARTDSIEGQSRLARRILDAHVVCIMLMTLVLAIQFIGA